MRALMGFQSSSDAPQTRFLGGSNESFGHAMLTFGTEKSSLFTHSRSTLAVVKPHLQAAERRDVVALLLETGRRNLLVSTGLLVIVIAWADWAVGNTVSLGVCYALPMMLGAVVLRTNGLVLLSIICAVLRSCFDTPGAPVEILLRFVFAVAAYLSAGLFVNALIRNRQLALDYVAAMQREQSLRQEAEEQLHLLIESSPAAILTLDGDGMILAANHAAADMFAIEEGGVLQQRNISHYLPVLADALRFQIGLERFRTAAQSQAYRDNGEIFLAHTWFSSYRSPGGLRLAAIVVDSSEEMRDREEQNLFEMREYNRIGAAALAHEVRNLCGAMYLVSANLRDRCNLAGDSEYMGLTNLIKGLEKIASLNLHSGMSAPLEEVSLQAVLDNLRILTESEWREINGVIHWPPVPVPKILGDPHGILQTFLNIVHNSFRAVQESDKRELVIRVQLAHGCALVRFTDSGSGVVAPERLFTPFQPGTNGAGLGLYVSRALVRKYGGDLRYERTEAGACFVVELEIA